MPSARRPALASGAVPRRRPRWSARRHAEVPSSSFATSLICWRDVKLIRLVLSDLHLGTGVAEGQLNPLEDFFYDDRFAELLDHYEKRCGEPTGIELILNGDIFDLL